MDSYYHFSRGPTKENKGQGIIIFSLFTRLGFVNIVFNT